MDQDSAFDSERFILSNHEVIKKRINLDELVPKLYNRQLLTSDEREELLFEQKERYKKKTRLIEIVSSKGDAAPWLLIECLREANEHLPHSELAGILERSLGLQSHGVSREPANQRHVSSHSIQIDASANSALHQSSHNQSSPCPENPIPGPSTSAAALGRSSQMPALCSDHMIRTAHPSTTCRPTGVSPATNSLEQLEISSPEFANLILGLASELSQHGTTFESIRQALLSLLEIDGIPIQLPSHVTDFPTLILHLRRLKMCHEYDVDLLCKLLEFLELVDLKDSVVKAYANKAASTDVIQCRYQRSTPSHRHFIAFTFHKVPSLSLGEACEIKHLISDILHIPRHCFTLVGSEEGSIGLAWQIPMEYRKHVQSSLREDESVRTGLTSSKYHFESIKLEVEGGSERVVAFTRPAGHISNTHIVGMTDAHASPCDQCCVSSQEDAISSTVDDLSPSIDSEYSNTLCTSTVAIVKLPTIFILRTFKEKSFTFMYRSRAP
jgi:hypothetical protein